MAKARFLSLLGPEPARSRSFAGRFELRPRLAIATLILFFSVSGGAAALADVSDVGPEHPLYPLKRVSEEVRVFLATARSQPELHKALAERRLKELQRVQSARLTIRKIKKLEQDLARRVDAVLQSAARAKREGRTDEYRELCRSVAAIVVKRHQVLGGWNGYREKLQGQCGLELASPSGLGRQQSFLAAERPSMAVVENYMVL